MRCPDCGYEADNASVFCPQCRYRFGDIIEDPDMGGDTIIDLPERGIVADESVFEEPRPEEERSKLFTDKELRQLEVQLLQPAVLVVLTIALVSYTVLSGIPFVPLSIAGLEFSVTGVLCLACGVVGGLVFFLITRRSLRKFRFR
jgi:hypothetical protein